MWRDKPLNGRTRLIWTAGVGIHTPAIFGVPQRPFGCHRPLDLIDKGLHVRNIRRESQRRIWPGGQSARRDRGRIGTIGCGIYGPARRILYRCRRHAYRPIILRDHQSYVFQPELRFCPAVVRAQLRLPGQRQRVVLQHKVAQKCAGFIPPCGQVQFRPACQHRIRLRDAKREILSAARRRNVELPAQKDDSPVNTQRCLSRQVLTRQRGKPAQI